MSNFKILAPPSDAHDYFHIVLALCLPRATAGYSLRILDFILSA